MRTFFKWIGAIGVFLALLLAAAGGWVYFSTQERLNRIYDISPEKVFIPADQVSIENGRHIFQFRGCMACHGDQLQGKIYLNDPMMGTVSASNLTRGAGGIGADYNDQDWVRSIRHGIRPNGKPLLFMPSTEFYFLSDADLGDVIAYIKSVPAAENPQAISTLSFTGRVVMTLVPAITFIPAELIPHSAPRPAAPARAETAAYGEYLTQSCKVCHGLGMSGGEIPGFPADWPPAANLTTSTERYLPYWSKSDFVKVIRTGVTRHGREIDPTYMPWTSYQYMDDLELQAVWLYLLSLPPRPFGSR